MDRQRFEDLMAELLEAEHDYGQETRRAQLLGGRAIKPRALDLEAWSAAFKRLAAAHAAVHSYAELGGDDA